MVFVFDRDVGLAQGITGVGNILGQALMQQGQLQQQEMLMQKERDRLQEQSKSYGTILQNTLGKVKDFSNQDEIMRSVIEAQEKGVPIEQISQYANMIKNFQSVKTKPSTPAESEFDKQFAKKKADWMFQMNESIPKQNFINESLNRLDELTKELSGPTGLAKAWWGTEAAEEFNSLALLSLEPILKIFNPTGTIPQSKIEMLTKKMIPQAGDRTSVINGKLNTLKSLAKKSEAITEQYQALTKLYGKNIPDEAILNMISQNESFIDDIIGFKEEKQTNKIEIDKPTSSNAKDFQGQIIENPKTGERLISDGKKWIKYKG